MFSVSTMVVVAYVENSKAPPTASFTLGALKVEGAEERFKGVATQF